MEQSPQEPEPMQFDELPPRPRLEGDKDADQIYGANPGVVARKESYVGYLNSPDYRPEVFTRWIENWNAHEEETKGFRGGYYQIDRVQCASGTLIVYYFRGSDSVKFGFLPE